MNPKSFEDAHILRDVSQNSQQLKFVIPKDHYFVLGETRDNSQDSRAFGFVNRSMILGQARYIYWSKDLSRIGMELH
jgi:signal peptidase I